MGEAGRVTGTDWITGGGEGGEVGDQTEIVITWSVTGAGLRCGGGEWRLLLLVVEVQSRSSASNYIYTILRFEIRWKWAATHSGHFDHDHVNALKTRHVFSAEFKSVKNLYF